MGANTPSSLVRRLLAGTTLLSVPLILLGIYTAIAGFGLTCEARWPLCDGAVFGLFPANWGSFIEWFHRLVAMIFGFAIIGTAVAVFRTDVAPRVKGAVGLATALTPLQIVFGALTVTSYEQLILATHFVTAALIFFLLVGATVWLFADEDWVPSTRTAGLFAGVCLIAGLPLVPGSAVALNLGLTGPELHTSFYFFTLLAAGGFVVAVVDAATPVRVAAFIGALIVTAAMVLSRVTLFPTDAAYVFLGVVAAIGAAAAVVIADARTDSARESASRIRDRSA